MTAHGAGARQPIRRDDPRRAARQLATLALRQATASRAPAARDVALRLREVVAADRCRVRGVDAPSPSALPVVRHLPDALRVASRGPLSAAVPPLRTLAPLLAWQSYGGTLDDVVGWADVVGPGAWVDADDVAVGVLVQAAASRYPLHAHPASERYVVASGLARSVVGDRPELLDPGRESVRSAGAPHSSTTAAAPLLVLWTWRGQVAEPSRLLVPA